MHPLSAGIRWWFESLDAERRRRGAAMDRMGYGPVESPCRNILAMPGMRLRHYGGNLSARNIALIVPAPIKRHYIWDMTPECSVVQQALRAGMQVYLIEWTDPHEDGIDFGLEDYAATLIGQCVESIRIAHGEGNLFLFGHSLGGVLAAVYAALRPDHVDGLVMIEAPLHFENASGSFTPLVAFGPRADTVTRMFGSVPGSLLSLTSVIASPSTFQIERNADFVASLGSEKCLKTHLMVERWTLDEAPMAGRLFEDVVEDLYRRDRFMRGTLRIAGRHLGPDRLVVPSLAVYDPRSVVIPPASIIAFHDAAGSRHKRLLVYQGDTGVALAHVGALIGENAHHRLWPEIFAWIESLAATRH